MKIFTIIIIIILFIIWYVLIGILYFYKNRSNKKPIIPKINMKCPYNEFSCTEYDTAYNTLNTDCRYCKNYNHGIIASKLKIL